MKTEKTFHCVRYKRAIQEKHASETRNLSPEEKMRRRAEWLEKSNNPAAQLWREMMKKRDTADRP